MQKKFYKPLADQWDTDRHNRNHVVGWFEEHNNWSGYEYLFTELDTSKMIALDFGCGPGRNIVKYWNRFARIDGVDIMEVNIINAKRWVDYSNLDSNSINLYTCNGYDLSDIPDLQYDMIFSTICMQHICVHEVRYNYFKEFYRVLKPNGYISIQMGYGRKPNSKCKDYYDNCYDAKKTNGDDDGEWDVTIESPDQIATDLYEIGFTNFEYIILPPFLGDRDFHEKFIIFRARKEGSHE